MGGAREARSGHWENDLMEARHPEMRFNAANRRRPRLGAMTSTQSGGCAELSRHKCPGPALRPRARRSPIALFNLPTNDLSLPFALPHRDLIRTATRATIRDDELDEAGTNPRSRPTSTPRPQRAYLVDELLVLGANTVSSTLWTSVRSMISALASDDSSASVGSTSIVDGVVGRTLGGPRPDAWQHPSIGRRS